VLEHAWLVVPALGPVLPVEEAGVGLVGDLSGRRPPEEVRGESAAPARPSREGSGIGCGRCARGGGVCRGGRGRRAGTLE
jgi:hypothetical protein